MRRTLIIVGALLVAILLVLPLAISGLALYLAPTVLAQQADNEVKVGFLTNWVHGVNGDSFTNAEVTGQRQWRIAEIINTTDETGEPIGGLRVTLDTNLAFDWIDNDEYLVRTGPPTYEWFYGNLSEDYRGRTIDAYVGFSQPTSAKLAPGFDVSRSFDKTVFTAPDTQTMTVRVTPREEWINKVALGINTLQAELVNAVITSVISEGNVNLAPDGYWLHIQDIPAEPNTPVNVTVTISITPKVPEVEFKPNVRVGPISRPSQPVQGTVRGSSFSYTDEAGTWTVSAEGDYVWNWQAHSTPTYGVALDPREDTSPVLEGGSVSPSSGTSKTPFAFEVTYRDMAVGHGNFVPSYVRVYIDGATKDMGWVSGDDYRTGIIFGHTTTLNAGQHTYYFEASDDFFTTRFPESGTLSIEVARQGLEFLIWIIPVIVIIGLIIYFFIRRRRRGVV